MKKKDGFILGRPYSRKEIHQVVGGETQTYLPQKHNKIVCGCFRMDTNPQAPREILPGDAPMVLNKARLLCDQVDPIPVFIQRGPSQWEYIGDYIFQASSTNPALLKQKNIESHRKNVMMVLYLKQAK